MSHTNHHHGEYLGSIDDILDRHENPHNFPVHYPNFSDKKWAAIYHIHRKAIRLIEKENAENEKRQLQETQIEFTQILHALIHKKEDQKKKQEEQKQRLGSMGLIKSGNKKTILQSIIATDYSDLDDDFIVWLWNFTLYFSKKAATKTIRNNTTGILNKLEPIMTERGLPLGGNALINRINQIPADELKSYSKIASGFMG